MKLATFVEKFDLLAEAPNAMEAFREIFLQFAVRGRLAKQSDRESAAEQLALAEAFRMRRGRRDAPDTVDVPFPIPGNWGWVAVGDAMEMVNGRAFKPDEWSAEGTPIIRIQNLNNKTAPFNRCNAELPAKFQVRDGDFLISWSGTPGTSFGAFIWSGGFAYLNQHIFRCELVEGLFVKEFLRLAINARLDEMISHAHGAAGLRHITKGKLESIRLPLPPLAEQKRIVARLGELIALCDRLETQKHDREVLSGSLAQASLARFADSATPANLDLLFHSSYTIGPADLRRSVLTLAVQGQLSGSAERRYWPVVTMKEVCLQITDGEHATPQRVATGVPLATAKNVRDGFLDLAATDYVAPSTADKCWRRCKPRDQDILMVCVGATTGRVCLVEDPPDLVLVRSVALIRPDTTRILPGYLDLFLRSPVGQTQIWGSVKQSAQPCLYLGKMSQFEIALPSLEEQRYIVSRVAQLAVTIDSLEGQIASSTAAAQELMGAAVSELVAQA